MSIPSTFLIIFFPKQGTPDSTTHHPSHFIIPNSATLAYQQTFYSRTIKEWNHLHVPTEIIEQESLNFLTDKLSYYYRTN